MGFFDSIFGKKPTKRDIAAFNYYLFFTYIPKQLKSWSLGKSNLQNEISLDADVLEKHPEWKSLNKKIEVATSTLKKYEDLTVYLVKAPTTEMMGEVIAAMFAVNLKFKKYEYYTMEFSMGCFAICSADEESNHYYISECGNAEEFGTYVIKQAIETLMPAPNPTNKPTTPPVSTSQSNTPNNSKPKKTTIHTAESFLKILEKIADDYYKQRGVVSLEDWLVTKKEGNQFKFYLTQNPDTEFEDPYCEVTLMVEFMDHNGRMHVVDKFFPNNTLSKLLTKQEPEMPRNTPVYPNAIVDTYYSLEQLRQIPMGDLRLQPIDAGIVFDSQQQEIISLFAEKSPRIKRFLPNLDLSSPEAVQKYFTTFCQKTEMQMEFGYSIKMNKHGDLGYMGFIFVHTPLLNKVAINFPQWTIDFCMFEPLEGKRFMRTSLRHVLLMLKNELGVKNIFAIVDDDNTQCLNFMKSLPFQLQPEVLTDPATGKKAKLFMCPLSKIEITFKSQS